MASMTPRKKPKPIEISKYLGINEAVGGVELEVGEFLTCDNFRITKDYRLQKRPGHHKILDFGNDSPTSIFQTTLKGEKIMIVVNGGKVYKFTEEEYNGTNE